MSRKNTEKSLSLRQKFNYNKEFDVTLACGYGEEENLSNLDLYERIGKVVENVGKRPFVAHKEFSLLEDEEIKNYKITNKIIIPSSDLLLCYLGELSSDTGIMLSSAIENEIPIIYLDERERNIEALSQIALPLKEFGEVSLRKIVDEMRTKSQKKCLEFDSVNIGNRGSNLSKLETALKEFYLSYQNP